MPSQHFPNQTVLFSIGHQGHWYALGASGTFLLPYLRALYTIDQQQPLLNHWIHSPTPLNHKALHCWIGTLYVEYEQEDNLIATPSRVEWSGTIHAATPEDIGDYFNAPPSTDIGLIGIMPGSHIPE
ncbi:MAG: hypothetical protein NDI90_02180 [Nitrospira sp. BO4]|jgi:hypothetical protein|nr:hypothetical protein [Nitrospira sp. BO4]